MIDLNKFPMHERPYADSTLQNKSKKELIKYIRCIEHNYGSLYWFYNNAVNANLERFKDFEHVTRCKDCIKKDICILYRDTQDEDGFCKWAGKKNEGVRH